MDANGARVDGMMYESPLGNVTRSVDVECWGCVVVVDGVDGVDVVDVVDVVDLVDVVDVVESLVNR